MTQLQVKIGQTAEAVLKEDRDKKDAALRCDICKEIKEKHFDICPNLPNLRLCVDCIRKRHNLEGPGFEIFGDEVVFNSETTGIIRMKLSRIFRVFDGSMFPNEVYPYCINCTDDKYGTNCLGITREFGDWLIANMGFIETVQKNDSGEEYDDDGRPLREWQKAETLDKTESQ